MNKDTIKQKIKGRKISAKRRQLFDKGKTIVQTFACYDTSIGGKNSFDDGDIFIEYNNTPIDFSGSVNIVRVVYKGKQVFSQYDDIVDAYVPGEWEKIYNSLYEKALKEPKERLKKELDDTWGI